jgi:uncharacterized membrane protein
MTQFPSAKSNLNGRANLVLYTLCGYLLLVALFFWPWVTMLTIVVLLFVLICLLYVAFRVIASQEEELEDRLRDEVRH